MTDFTGSLDSAWENLREQAASEATKPAAPAFKRGASASTPSTPAKAPKPNQYAGICTKCGNRVEEGAGFLGDKVDGRWTVIHIEGECPEAVEVTEDNPFDADAILGQIVIDPGTYTVQTSDGHRTFKVVLQAPDAEFAPGETIIELLTGRDNESDYRSLGFVKPGPRVAVWGSRKDMVGTVVQEALDIFMADPNGEGEDVLKSVNCIRCNAKLSRPDSIGRNMGPDCSREWGW